MNKKGEMLTAGLAVAAFILSFTVPAFLKGEIKAPGSLDLNSGRNVEAPNGVPADYDRP